MKRGTSGIDSSALFYLFNPNQGNTMNGKYENTNPLEKLHDGEPYFFLRAQDIHAPYAVRQYAEAVGVLDPKGKAECLAFADRMEKWQDANRDKVKQPD